MTVSTGTSNTLSSSIWMVRSSWSSWISCISSSFWMGLGSPISTTRKPVEPMGGPERVPLVMERPWVRLAFNEPMREEVFSDPMGDTWVDLFGEKAGGMFVDRRREAGGAAARTGISETACCSWGGTAEEPPPASAAAAAAEREPEEGAAALPPAAAAPVVDMEAEVMLEVVAQLLGY